MLLSFYERALGLLNCLSPSIRLITSFIQPPTLSTIPVTFPWRSAKWGLFLHWSGWWVGLSTIVKHPLTRDYWHAFTGKFRAWKETFLTTMGPVCVAGAGAMNRAPKCITVTRQPVINANKMKGSYQKRQTQTWAVSEQKRWMLFLAELRAFICVCYRLFACTVCVYVHRWIYSVLCIHRHAAIVPVKKSTLMNRE